MDIHTLTSHPFWADTFLGNTVGEYAIACGVFVLALVVLGLFKKVILWRLAWLAKQSETDIDDTLIAIVRRVNPPFYAFIAFYIGLQFIELRDIVAKAITAVILIWVTHLVIQSVKIFINRIVKVHLGEDDGSSRAAIQLLSGVLTFVLWVIGLLLVLQNLGVNVTSLIAGLGIGGVAIALALQSILGDLFSSFAIVFDKPFAIGDFIIVGETMGTVEHIGIKTTRLRSLSGEQITISNTDLTGARIQNYKRMEERRVVFTFGVTYETPHETLERIPELVRLSVEAEEKTRFDRAHFKEFGDSAYVYEVVYYVLTADYNEHAQIHERICLAIIKQCRREGIEMAYPTRMVYLANNPES